MGLWILVVVRVVIAMVVVTTIALTIITTINIHKLPIPQILNAPKIKIAMKLVQYILDNRSSWSAMAYSD